MLATLLPTTRLGNKKLGLLTPAHDNLNAPCNQIMMLQKTTGVCIILGVDESKGGGGYNAGSMVIYTFI